MDDVGLKETGFLKKEEGVLKSKSRDFPDGREV